MKTLKLISIMAFAAIIAACGNKDNKTTTESPAVEKVTGIQKISGPLGQYFEVVPKEYKVREDKSVNIEVKRIKEGLPEPWKKGLKIDFSFDNLIDLRPLFCDKDGEVVREDGSIPGFFCIPQMEELMDLPIGETMIVKVFVEGEECQVKFKSAFKLEGDSSSSADSDDNNSDSDGDEVAENSSANFDELLDSYEKYVDRYISVMKKAKNGDASAMSEYPGLLEEANELSSKIQNVQGELTSSQLSRYTKISNKMLKAAQDMQ